MSLQPFRITVPTGPLTRTYVVAAMQKALGRLLASEGDMTVPEPIRWAIVAESREGWILEGVCEGLAQDAGVRDDE